MIPVMLVLNCLSDLTLTDFKAGSNVIAKEQAYYNSEIGICDALNRYGGLSYSGFRISIYYIELETDTPKIATVLPNSNDYIKVKVSYEYKNGKKLYTVDAIGYYYESEKEGVYKFSE